MKQEVFFEDIRKEIIKLLSECESELKIAVAWFTDKKIISEVNKLIDRGVDISIIIYDDRINQKDLFEKLYYSNTKIYLSKKLMHNKFCIIDDRIVVSGSYNWTVSAHTNNENILVTYNNYDLVNKFDDEFEKLKLNCKTIDDHFKYSLSNLEKIEDDFETYYLSLPDYQFPYFIDLTNFKPSRVNILTSVKDYVYLLKNREEEKRFLWYYFLLQSNYSLGEILKIKQQKLDLPLKFNYVHQDRKDEYNVSEFLKEKYVVEEHNKYSGKFVFSINNLGQPISEKFTYTDKLSDDLYVMKKTMYLHGPGTIKQQLPYFINKDLTKIIIDYKIEEIIDNKAFIILDYGKDKSSFGLLNTNNDIIIPAIFDDYCWKNEYIDFIEYPVLKVFKNNSKTQSQIRSKYPYKTELGDKVLPITIKRDFYKRIDTSIDKEKKLDIDYDIVVHRYSVSNFKLLDRFILEGNKRDQDETCYFMCALDYKYKDLYERIIKFNKKDSSLYITLTEFIALRSNYSDEIKLTELFAKFENSRFRLKQENEAIHAKNKEGCYIATMVYKSYDHPDVLLLRQFRDQNLQTNSLGKMFIKGYYKYSPKYVRYVRDKKILHKFSKIMIYLTVKSIKTCFKLGKSRNYYL